MKGKTIKRATGGSAMLVSGNPNVIKEARERKKGGKVVRKDGGKVIGLMTGGGVKQRFDRPGRKMGGKVGANAAPLSTANRSASAEKLPKTQEGGASD